MTRDITLTISVRRDRDSIALDEHEIEGTKASLLRSSYMHPAAAIRIGREMVRLGLEAAREGAAR